MTNLQKQEVVASIEILKEAHEEIKRTLKNRDTVTAQNMLAECQEVAVALGEYIEKLENKEHTTIFQLEEYCEVLFQIYEELDGGQFDEGKIYKKLRKQLIKMENSAKHDISVRLQIVFFPYKASMWDSMESIYLAAKADADCDVYCVPIPYYDLNLDHSTRKMHYEIDEYPDNIELTDWCSYDVENQKPDIVYIHNPYDSYNYVTSVHPRYYSENLKKYVGTLVYVPYNVTGGSLGEIHRLQPSYFNMDYIIAQNENQRLLYDSRISDKVKVFGSPKFDKVINQVITQEMIPEEWRSKLKNSVFFLNTGIDGLLKHNEESLLKIQYILKIAEEENVTILWRPHPLLEATIRSLRPHLWNLYMETIEKFQRYQNGILDCTGNAELAIGLSDAYIGEDTSSISHMFGVLGKPLFFIRQSIREEVKGIEHIELSCCTADVADGDMIWAVAASRNALLRITRDGVVWEVYVIPNERDVSNLYSDILMNGNKLYLVPCNASEIAIFDVSEKKFTKISLNDSGKKDKFNKGYLYKDKIYLVPRTYEKMVILHCDEEKLCDNRLVIDELKKITEIPDVLVESNGSQLIGEKLYIAVPDKPYVLEYNVKTQENRRHKIQGASVGFCCLEKVSDKIILGSMTGSELFVWEPLTGKTESIKDFPEGWKTDGSPCFGDILELGGDAYIFPRTNRGILRLSMKDLTLTILEKDFPFFPEEREGAFFTHADYFPMVTKLVDGSVVVQDANGQGLSEFYADGSFEWKQVCLSEQEELLILGKLFSKIGKNLPWGIYETRYSSVRRFISYIRQDLHDKELQKQAFSDVAVNLDGTAGKKIHEFMRRQQ